MKKLTQEQMLILKDANVNVVRSWILSLDKIAGEERGLRISQEEVRPRVLASHLQRFIKTFGMPDLNVRIYNFADRSEVWTSYEPSGSQ